MAEYSNSNPPKLPKRANRTATYTKEITYCSECPSCRFSPIYYDSEVDQEVRDMHCDRQDSALVHWALHWTEIAEANSRHDGCDYVPETCPLLKDEPIHEPIDDTINEPICETYPKYSDYYQTLKSE